MAKLLGRRELAEGASGVIEGAEVGNGRVLIGLGGVWIAVVERG
ncbi:MAG TPA: hypothetical protein VEX13_01775 [Chloroflexia bacterium]|nr:hypothetical protein [Chloroflexia bacterium]